MEKEINAEINTETPEEKKAFEQMVQVDNVIDFDNLKTNSVVVLKIGGSPEHKLRMHQAFVKFVKSKNETFKKKSLTVLFLEPEDSLEILTEQDMEAAGWAKKEKSLILKPFEK